MAAEILEHAAAEVHRGKYGAALNILSKLRETDPEPDVAILHSEVLQRVGKYKEAVELASLLLKKQALAPSVYPRCYMVLGSVSAVRGNSDSIPLLRKAVQLAEISGDIEWMARAQQRLFSHLSDSDQLNAAVALLPDLRRVVSHCGQAQMTAELHASLARADLGRGLWDRAQRRLVFALGLLREDPNVWLQGRFKADASATACLASEFRQAIKFANEALECAEKSEVHISKIAALANLAWGYVALGELEKAESTIRAALKCVGEANRAHGALLDTEAHLRMYSGDWEGCEEVLDEIERRFVNDPAYKYSWLNAEVFVTRARLLCRQGAWASARTIAEKGLSIARERGDQYPELLLRILLTESLLELGETPLASTALWVLARRIDGSSLAVLADTERVRGKAFALADSPKAPRTFERALRVARPVGHVRGAQETITDLV